MCGRCRSTGGDKTVSDYVQEPRPTGDYHEQWYCALFMKAWQRGAAPDTISAAGQERINATDSDNAVQQVVCLENALSDFNLLSAVELSGKRSRLPTLLARNISVLLLR